MEFELSLVNYNLLKCINESIYLNSLMKLLTSDAIIGHYEYFYISKLSNKNLDLGNLITLCHMHVQVV